MVLLVDERPEEVTDMRRHVQRGEVVASTFDRPSESAPVSRADHRAGQAPRGDGQGRGDRARRHHPARPRPTTSPPPVSGRVLSGGVDAAHALYPPKRFFGAARNVEEGGSLTIIATALHRDRLEDGRGDLRGLQGHRQHGAATRPAAARSGASTRPSTSSSRAPVTRSSSTTRGQLQPDLEAAPGAQRPRGRCRPRAPDRQAADHQDQRGVPHPRWPRPLHIGAWRIPRRSPLASRSPRLVFSLATTPNSGRPASPRLADHEDRHAPHLRQPAPCAAPAATSSTTRSTVPPCASSSARSATPSSPASRSSSTPVVGSSGSSAAYAKSTPRRVRRAPRALRPRRRRPRPDP